MMLSITNLHATVGNNQILNGIHLTINPGQVHAIMGPNGSGKTTLSNILSGCDGYTVTQGGVLFCGKDLLSMLPEERAVAGLFVGMQYPVEIPGVNNAYFLKTAINAVRQKRGESLLDAFEFMQVIKSYLSDVQMDEQFLKRAVNDGFSGGEKKRNEILQMLLLQPRLTILDELDSGLDVDALQIVASGVNRLRDKTRSFLLITHYQRLLNFVEPDFVHVMSKGKIVKSGDIQLAHEIEKYGYVDC